MGFNLIKRSVIITALIGINGCASVAMEGSYFDFRDNMSDEKALSYYSTQGLCELKDRHLRLARSNPYYSANDPDWISTKDRLLSLIEEKGTFSQTELDLVKDQKIQRGMSELAAYCSWGFPIRKNNNTGSWGRSTQAVLPGDTYLYFDNGVLKSWQTSD